MSSILWPKLPEKLPAKPMKKVLRRELKESQAREDSLLKKRKPQEKEKQAQENGSVKSTITLLKFTTKAKLKPLTTRSFNIKLLD